MSAAPAPRSATASGDAAAETRAGALPPVIYLPDERPPRKKAASGSESRRRRHLERFRTDDNEHAALHAKLRASGKSLGAYVMELAAIEATAAARARRRSDPPIDAPALMQAVAAFNRQHSNYNQAVRALNTLALVADERSNRELADQVRVLQAEIVALQQNFAAPLAAILGAVRGDRQG